MAKAKKVKKAAPKKVVKKAAAKGAKKAAAPKTITPDKLAKLSYEELVSANITAMTQTIGNLSDTVDIIAQKMESLAFHVIAIEGVLAAVVAANGIDIAAVNSNISCRVSGGTDGKGNANRAIDIAATIVSPLPKKKAAARKR